MRLKTSFDSVLPIHAHVLNTGNAASRLKIVVHTITSGLCQATICMIAGGGLHTGRLHATQLHSGGKLISCIIASAAGPRNRLISDANFSLCPVACPSTAPGMGGACTLSGVVNGQLVTGCGCASGLVCQDPGDGNPVCGMTLTLADREPEPVARRRVLLIVRCAFNPISVVENAPVLPYPAAGTSCSRFSIITVCCVATQIKVALQLAVLLLILLRLVSPRLSWAC